MAPPAQLRCSTKRLLSRAIYIYFIPCAFQAKRRPGEKQFFVVLAPPRVCNNFGDTSTMAPTDGKTEREAERTEKMEAEENRK
jgi:hypothetical protein